jgi:hypothetical protein
MMLQGEGFFEEFCRSDGGIESDDAHDILRPVRRAR